VLVCLAPIPPSSHGQIVLQPAVCKPTSGAVGYALFSGRGCFATIKIDFKLDCAQGSC